MVVEEGGATMESLSDTDRTVPVRRDQGDGSAMPDIPRGEAQLNSSPKPSNWFHIKVNLDCMQVIVTLVSIFTRMWNLEKPRAVVFDEMHFGRFASMYLKNIFFFDVHPPLGSLLLATMGYFAEFNGDFNFPGIGAEYPPAVPLWHLRFLPSLCGALLAPVAYQICVELNLSRWTATLTALLFVLDNAMLTQSRFILLEPMLLLFCMWTILSYVKFKQYSTRVFSLPWCLWLISIGVSSAAAISVKYIGFLTFILVWSLMIRDFWKMLSDRTLSNIHLFQQFTARIASTLVFPCMLYLAVFYVHLQILYKAGPHDDVMTSSFQSSLEGGLASITKGQPLYIAYGSQVTLRPTHGRMCWLHSHKHVYPIRYPDGRGSSHQQQVTCYGFKDPNNWWIVKHPEINSLTVEDPVQKVQHGDIIQLVHGMTTRALNSHDVAAPISPQNQEVTGYIDYNISFPPQNLWKLEILNREADDNSWKTIQSQIRLVHVNTSQALKITGKQLPDWGFRQGEVATDKIIEQEATVWNVEEHRYTRNEEDMEKDLTNTEMIPLEPKPLSFFSKFWELQVKIFTSKRDAELEHKFSSEPSEWPLMERNVAYWLSPSSNAQIHLIGNPVIWYTGTICTVVYAAILLIHVLRRRRGFYDITSDEWKKFVAVGEIFFTGYLINFLWYLLTERTLFLHHYLPSLQYQLLLLPAVVEHIYYLIWSQNIRRVYTMLLAVWVTVTFNTFLEFSAFSYGVKPLDSDTIQSLKWKDSWDFFIHK